MPHPRPEQVNLQYAAPNVVVVGFVTYEPGSGGGGGGGATPPQATLRPGVAEDGGGVGSLDLKFQMT